ncbi:MAG TPA: hypothetical protein VE619_11930 [Nitrososphaeraceae archaeon]|nr:hypothetical protein [Nitrososphaeraceae archaeon]
MDGGDCYTNCITMMDCYCNNIGAVGLPEQGQSKDESALSAASVVM